MPQGQVDMTMVGRLNLDCVEARSLPFSWIACIPNGGQIFEVLTVNLENIGQVNSDKRHPIRNAGNGAHPCLAKTVHARSFSRERFVQRARFLPESLPSVLGSRDVTHFAVAGLTDTDDTVFGHTALFNVELSFSRNFLDKRRQWGRDGWGQRDSYIPRWAFGWPPRSRRCRVLMSIRWDPLPESRTSAPWWRFLARLSMRA